MVHKISDTDPNRGLHEKFDELHKSTAELHAKFDKMLEHLATIAGAVKAPEGNEQPQSSPGERDKSG